MDSGPFQFLFDSAARDPLLFVSVAVGIPLILAFLLIATVKRMHPLAVWVVLFGSGFAFSQLFPENRDQRRSLAIGDCIFCTVIT